MSVEMKKVMMGERGLSKLELFLCSTLVKLVLFLYTVCIFVKLVGLEKKFNSDSLIIL